MTGSRWWIVLLLCGLALLRPPAVLAHVGAPYPVLLEEEMGSYIVSVLADPDVGTGTFYILLTLRDGEPPPPDARVTLWAEPEDGHRAASRHEAERQETRYGERFVVKVPFDEEGAWQIGLNVEGSTGFGEIAFPVEVTPSGIGWLATLACLLPFVLLGGLWLRGTMRQRQAGQS